MDDPFQNPCVNSRGLELKYGMGNISVPWFSSSHQYFGYYFAISQIVYMPPHDILSFPLYTFSIGDMKDLYRSPNTGVCKLFLKNQRVNILGFVSYIVSILTTQLPSYIEKTAIDNM